MGAIYTAVVDVTGGREGRAVSGDGKLDVQLATPKEFGPLSSGKDGTNPEQLFAAGYGACFESVLRHVAQQQNKSVTRSSIRSQVEVHPKPGGGFMLATTLNIRLEGISREEARQLVDVAHTICPYSNITRGNMPVTLNLE